MTSSLPCNSQVKQPLPGLIAMASGLLLLCLLSLSCEKDPAHNGPELPGIREGQGAFVVNEGNFGWGNASLSYYDKTTDSIYHNLYSRVNNKPLGDVFQSMTIHNGLAYLVINNSGTIEIINPHTFQHQGTITGLVSPRYLLPVNASRAYVSDLYGNGLSIADLQGMEITGQIPMRGWTEAMLRLGERVLVAGTGSGYLYAIDTETDRLTDSLHLPPGPQSMVVDAAGYLWVLSGGEPMLKGQPGLYQIEPRNLEILGFYPLGKVGNPISRLQISPCGETLYFLGRDIFSMSTADPQSGARLFVASKGRGFYGLSADPDSGEIYVTDAIDYVQPGIIMRFSSQGLLISSQRAGIIPADLGFY